MRFALQIFAVAASGLACTPVSAADYVKSESGDASVYSRAVIATGGRIRRLTGADAGHYPQSLRQSAAEFFKTDFPALLHGRAVSATNNRVFPKVKKTPLRLFCAQKSACKCVVAPHQKILTPI